jgi:hypothetical protein
MRLRLEYFDQNEAFAKVLPKAGEVDRKLKSHDGNEWVMFRLDAPARYEETYYEHFLLRSRWSGSTVGDRRPTSVFILLVAEPEKAKDGFNVHDFPHVAWGMAHRL